MHYDLKDIGSWVKKAKNDTNKARREAILRLFRAVVFDTPVAEGTLRGNWQCSIARPIEGAIVNRSATQVMDEIQSILSGSKLEDTVYLRNNLPYAVVVEYGLYPNPPKGGDNKTINGYSRKSPAGMVRKNVFRFGQIADAVARSMNP